VRKFPTLPLNSSGVWIDPSGGVWRQANDIQNMSAPGVKAGGEESDIPSQQPPQHLILPDYER
jgi:hypothetical protein